MVACEQTFGPNRLGFDRVFPTNLYYKSVEWEKILTSSLVFLCFPFSKNKKTKTKKITEAHRRASVCLMLATALMSTGVSGLVSTALSYN